MANDPKGNEKGSEDVGDARFEANEVEAVEASAKSTKSVEEELEAAKKDYLYLRAEFENYKKNAMKERSDLRKFAGLPLVQDLLKVVDIFDKALETELTTENLATFREGMELTAQELKRSLESYGVTRIESAGQAFDPAIHEALTSQPTDTVAPGHICAVLREAYRLHDRLVRPAQVVVATAPTGPESEPA